MKIIKEWWVIIKSRCNNPEQWAIEQAIELSRLPFLYKHVALMPDTHQWYGMPIGWVIACKDVVIPNAVGVDIGCGMCAVRTSLEEIDIETLKKILWEIREQVPVWFDHHKEKQQDRLITNRRRGKIVEEQYDKALYQIGTLWGGNHFIEIQKGSDWYIWIMIHSWSRNVWLQVAKYYNDLAKELNKKRYSYTPNNDLCFLPVNSEEWQSYIKEMEWCLDFAKDNRYHMLSNIVSIFVKETWCFVDEPINIHHNYASLESHWWENVWVHRKWATSAREWQLGIIPWSQWTKSYIVEWLGNKESFMSCSHWAGRKMWRKEAEKKLDLKEQQEILDSQGILHAIRWMHDLDEAPWAYKDIDIVMEEQKDLVKILVELTPLAVIKG